MNGVFVALKFEKSYKEPWRLTATERKQPLLQHLKRDGVLKVYLLETNIPDNYKDFYDKLLDDYKKYLSSIGINLKRNKVNFVQR